MADKRTPELRFEGYDGDWEEKKLGTIFGTTNERNHPELPVASASQEYGMIIRDQLGIDISYNKENAVTYKKVEPGNYVIHLRSFQGGFAHSKVTAITSPAYTIMEFLEKEKHDDLFWKYLFTSDEFIERLKIVTYGIRDGRSINFEDCAKLPFIFPRAGEQQQIGSFFKNLDQQILLAQEKLEKTKTLKKTMLQKMFPLEGSKIPEIRLEGFSGDWEEKKFGVVFGTTNERNHPELPVLSASQEFGMIVRDTIGIDITYDKKNISTYKIVHPGNFVSHLRSFQGGFAHSRIEGITSPAYTILEFKEPKHDDSFWKHLLTSKSFIKSLEIVTYGIRDGRSINHEDVSALKMKYPSLEEQKAISNFFDNLSEMITTQSQKLDLLKTLKKSLLEKMFV